MADNQPANAKKNLVESVSKEMKAKIVSSEWKVGDKLPCEKDLAQTFSVSRNTIRGALYLLNAAGLVETRHGSGSYVCRKLFLEQPTEMYRFETMNADDIANLLEFRRAVEPYSAFYAAKRRDENDLYVLKKAVLDMHENFNNTEKYTEADLCFHLLMAKATKNDVFYNVICNIAVPLRKHFMEMNKSIGSEFSVEDHIKIYHAIENREPETAKLLVYSLIDHSLNILCQ